MEARVTPGVETRSHVDVCFQALSCDQPWETSEEMRASKEG